MNRPPARPDCSAAREAASALRHAATLADIAADGPDREAPERHIRAGIAAALTALKGKP